MFGPFLVLINNKIEIKIIKIDSVLKNNILECNHYRYNIINDIVNFKIRKRQNDYFFTSSKLCIVNSEIINGDEVLLDHGTVITYKMSNKYLITCIFMNELCFSDKKYILNEEIKKCLFSRKTEILLNGKKNNNQNIKEHDILILDKNIFIYRKSRVIAITSELEIGNQKFYLTYDESMLNRLVLENVTLRNRIEDISFTVNPGELVAIIGKSGTGKTTLINLITGILTSDSGRIYLSNIGKITNSYYGLVSQTNHLQENLTVQELFQIYAKIYCDSLLKDEKNEKIKNIINELKLSGLENRYYSEISGGEKKRVAIGIELLNEPAILFLDEPDASLSPELVSTLLKILKEICNKRNTIVIVITHHSTYIKEHFDKVIVLSKDNQDTPATLAFYGTPLECLNHYNINNITEVYDLL